MLETIPLFLCEGIYMLHTREEAVPIDICARRIQIMFIEGIEINLIPRINNAPDAKEKHIILISFSLMRLKKNKVMKGVKLFIKENPEKIPFAVLGAMPSPSEMYVGTQNSTTTEENSVKITIYI